MNFNINKIIYNATNIFPKKEKVQVELAAKFAVGNENFYFRAFFVELNITGSDSESKKETRNVTIVAKFEYILDEKMFPEITEDEIEIDNKYFSNCLHILNKTLINVTSNEDQREPLDIIKVIERFEENN